MSEYASVEVNGLTVVQDDGDIRLSFEENGYDITIEVNRRALRTHVNRVEDESTAQINTHGSQFVGQELLKLGSIGVAAEPTDEKWDELASTDDD